MQANIAFPDDWLYSQVTQTFAFAMTWFLLQFIFLEHLGAIVGIVKLVEVGNIKMYDASKVELHHNFDCYLKNVKQPPCAWCASMGVRINFSKGTKPTFCLFLGFWRSLGWMTEGQTASPGKLNIKLGPYLSYSSVSVLLDFSRLLFFVFFGIFSGDFGF